MGGPSIVRRPLAFLALVALACVALMGADSSPFPAPVVIVYPLTGTGGTPADVGGNVALLLSTKLAQLGGITVKPYTPGTQRPQYLQAAIDGGADYYITGYLTPVGPDVSLITQIVSTHSGSIAFSSTSIVRTYGDVIGQADTLREAILRHAGRGFPAVEQPAPVPTDTPEGSGGKGGGVNLSKALARHARNQPSPSPAASSSVGSVALGTPPSAPAAGPTPIAPAPASSRTAAAAPSAVPSAFGTPPAALADSKRPAKVALVQRPEALVAQFDGAGSDDQRGFAQTKLAQALFKAGLAGGAVPVDTTAAVKDAAKLCAATSGSKAIVTAALQYFASGKDAPTIEMDTVTYDCNGVALGKQTVTEKITRRDGLDGAIGRAAAATAAAVKNLLTPNAGAS